MQSQSMVQSLQHDEDNGMSFFEVALRQPICFPIVKWFNIALKRVMNATKLFFCSWPFAVLSVSSYLAIIATVAVYDIQLTIRYAKSLKQYEQNPIGRWLMNLDQIGMNTLPDLTLFLALKIIGTLLVLFVIVGLVRWRARVGHPVGVGVASFQIGLACYLT